MADEYVQEEERNLNKKIFRNLNRPATIIIFLVAMGLIFYFFTFSNMDDQNSMRGVIAVAVASVVFIVIMAYSEGEKEIEYLNEEEVKMIVYQAIKKEDENRDEIPTVIPEGGKIVMGAVKPVNNPFTWVLTKYLVGFRVYKGSRPEHFVAHVDARKVGMGKMGTEMREREYFGDEIPYYVKLVPISDMDKQKKFHKDEGVMPQS